MTVTLTGEVERVTYENEETGFRVLRLGSVEKRGRVVVVGVVPAVGEGARVRVTGKFVMDPRHGEQLRADTLVEIVPSTIVGLERYLGSGRFRGIGPGFAKRIVGAFGLETLDVLDRAPGRLTEVQGLGGKRAEEMARAWGAERGTSSVMLLLQTHGASPSLAARIVQRYGERAAAVVTRSPYRLALEVRGVGFKTADRIARSLGISGDHPERAQAGVMHELGVLEADGHVLWPRPALVERAASMLEIDAGHVEAAIDALYAGEHVVVEDDAVYAARLHASELSVVRHMQRLLGAKGAALAGLNEAIRSFESRARMELAPRQREAVEGAARHKVLVVTGGPGVGKTTIVRAMLSVFDAAKLHTRLAAPTGRAAKRLSEATGKDAVTLHRLLEFDPRGRTFQRGAGRPLEAHAVIADEASMIDLPMAEALLSALPSSARLVLVGDADQLPSVGPGAVLRDVLASGVVPSVRLDEIFRQAGTSGIVENAHRVHRGEPPIGAATDDARADFFVISRREPEEAAHVIEELVTRRIPARFGLDPQRDVQVLTPMHRGPAGTAALNALLQAGLNPRGAGLERGSITLRAGDKVMQTKNDYDRDVFNGDIGIVLRVDAEQRALLARFDDREVKYDDADLDALVLAYATSIHKSQGSEYPAVVIPLLTSHFVMLSRNLLYTAVTRARKLCVLVADPRALKLALAETRKEDRMTRLAERLREAVRRGPEPINPRR